jgi:aminoglycoside phosphotransferase (APT) family kinase protein
VTEDLVPPERLDRWLTEAAPGLRPAAVRRLAGGQSNPVFLIEGPGERAVLRRKPPGPLLKLAHAVDREFRVLAALTATTVPVPRPIAYCADPDVLGTEFYLMAHVEGRVFDDPRLPDLTPAGRVAVFDAMAGALADLHALDPAAHGLADFGPQGDYFRRQIARWSRQYRATKTEPLADMDTLMVELERRPPADDGRRVLVHGDWRLDNLIWQGETPRIAAIVDWELSTLGHPTADVAQAVMQWRLPPGDGTRGLAGVDRAALGIPSDAAFVDRYAQASGTAPEGFDRALAFAFFRMAAILQGVKRRALDGNAADPERGLRLGAQVPRFAALGRAALG